MAVLGKTPRWARFGLFLALIAVAVGIPALFLGAQGAPSGIAPAALGSSPSPSREISKTPIAPDRGEPSPQPEEREEATTPTPRPSPSRSSRVRTVTPSTAPVAVKRQVTTALTSKQIRKKTPKGIHRCGTPSYVSDYPNYRGSSSASQLCSFTKMAVGSIYKRVAQVGLKRYSSPPITVVTSWDAYNKLNCKPQWGIDLDLAPIFWCGTKYGYILFKPALTAIFDGHGGNRIGSYSTLAVISVHVAALHTGQSSATRAACVSGRLLDGWYMFRPEQVEGYKLFLQDHAGVSYSSLKKGFNYGRSGGSCRNL